MKNVNESTINNDFWICNKIMEADIDFSFSIDIRKEEKKKKDKICHEYEIYKHQRKENGLSTKISFPPKSIHFI